MNILKYEDLIKIAQFLYDNGYDGYDITIENKVRTKGVLDKVNEEFFYRANPDTQNAPDECDVVNIDINGFKFRYISSDEDENQE